jgi:hypothetical protein
VRLARSHSVMSSVSLGVLARQGTQEALHRERLLPPPLRQHQVEPVTRRPARNGSDDRRELPELPFDKIPRRPSETGQYRELQQELGPDVAHVCHRRIQPTSQRGASGPRCSDNCSLRPARARHIAALFDETVADKRRERPIHNGAGHGPDPAE